MTVTCHSDAEPRLLKDSPSKPATSRGTADNTVANDRSRDLWSENQVKESQTLHCGLDSFVEFHDVSDETGGEVECGVLMLYDKVCHGLEH